LGMPNRSSGDRRASIGGVGARIASAFTLEATTPNPRPASSARAAQAAAPSVSRADENDPDELTGSARQTQWRGRCAAVCQERSVAARRTNVTWSSRRNCVGRPTVLPRRVPSSKTPSPRRANKPTSPCSRGNGRCVRAGHRHISAFIPKPHECNGASW
jgi:hypothetical protein